MERVFLFGQELTPRHKSIIRRALFLPSSHEITQYEAGVWAARLIQAGLDAEISIPDNVDNKEV